MSRPRPQTRRVAVESIRRIAPEVTLLALGWADGGAPFPFLAGQWVRVGFTVDGREDTRSFSIASPPSRTEGIELVILTRPGSRLSRHLTEELRRGDELALQGPYGVFTLPDPLDHDPLFVTESAGVSAIRSMVLGLFEKGTDRKVDLLFGATHENELLFRREFEAIPGLGVTWVLAHPGPGWTGATGTLAAAVRERLRAEPGRRIWISGFDWTVNPVNDVLVELKHPSDLVEIERYD